MARIDHIAVWTDDLDRLVAFYAQYFNAEVGALYTNPVKGFTSRFLAFEGGGRLEVMRTSMIRPVRLESGTQRMGLTHLALSVGAEARVDELTRTLREAGYAVLDGPRRTGDGYYESVVLDPDGNRIEIAA